MKAVVEFQGFLNPNNEYIIKELVIICVETELPQQWLFKPPGNRLPPCVKYSEPNKWLALHYHGIPWDSGETEYYQLENILRMKTYMYETIYTKGLEKSQYLSTLMRRCVSNLEDEGCPSVKTLQHTKDISCEYHKNTSFQCALHNAIKLTQWLVKGWY